MIPKLQSDSLHNRGAGDPDLTHTRDWVKQRWRPVRERSNIIWRFGRGVLKPSECRHTGGGGWPNRLI